MFAEFVSQNILWVAAFVVVANLLVFSFLQGNVRGVTLVPALQLPQLQRDQNHVIIDVNEADQFNRSHIPDARNFPVSSINADNQELVSLKDKTTIIVCQTGGRSAKAARQLQAMGFSKLHILRGGMLAWSKENLPVTSS